jgi:hypothetical protein
MAAVLVLADAKKKVLIKDRKSEAVGRQCLLHDMPGDISH